MGIYSTTINLNLVLIHIYLGVCILYQESLYLSKFSNPGVCILSQLMAIGKLYLQ